MASALKRFFVSYCIALLAVGAVVVSLLWALQPYVTNVWQRWFGTPEVCGCSTYAVLPTGPAGLILTTALVIGLTIVAMMTLRLALAAVSARALAKQLKTQTISTSYFRGLPVQLVQSNKALAVCIGFFHPTIYISTAMQHNMSGFELFAILQHESEHGLNWHPLQRLLLQAMPSWLPWWNHQIERYVAAQEIMADEAVIDKSALRTAFVKVISQASQPMNVAGATWFSPNEARVNHWLGERASLPSWKVVALGLVISLGVLLSSYTSFAAEPEAVAFGQCMQVQTMCKQVMSYNYNNL